MCFYIKKRKHGMKKLIFLISTLLCTAMSTHSMPAIVTHLPCDHRIMNTDQNITTLQTILRTQRCQTCNKHIPMRWLVSKGFCEQEWTSATITLLDHKFKNFTITTDDFLDEIAYIWENTNDDTLLYLETTKLFKYVALTTIPIIIKTTMILLNAQVPKNQQCLLEHIKLITRNLENLLNDLNITNPETKKTIENQRIYLTNKLQLISSHLEQILQDEIEWDMADTLEEII